MADKNTRTRTETSYTFSISHADVIDMMNDPTVNLKDGDVSADQVLAVSLKKPSGAELFLKDMRPNDKLVFRFNAVSAESDPESFDGIDVS